jgi:hypothetical protein
MSRPEKKMTGLVDTHLTQPTDALPMLIERLFSPRP